MAGSRVHSLLSRIGISDEEFYRFASDAYKGCKQTDLKPSELVEIAKAIFEIQSESGVQVQDLPSQCKDLQAKKEDLKGEVLRLEEQKQKARKEMEDELVTAKLTKERIKDYVLTKESLEKLGVGLDDLDKLATMLQNSSGYDFEIKDIIDKLQKGETIEEQIKALQEQNKALENTLESLNHKLKEAGNNYDMTSKKLEDAKIKYGHLENTIKIIEELQRKGIGPLNIAQWNDILVSSNTPAYNFEEELRQYSGLKKVISNLQTNSDKLKTEKAGLESRIEILKKEKEEIVSSIEQTKESALKSIEEVKQRATSYLGELEKKTGASMDSLRSQSSDTIKELAANTQGDLKNIVASFDNTITEISRYSETFGKLVSLRPLFEIMTGQKGNPYEIYLATDVYLQQFLMWLGPSKTSMKMYVKNLREEIAGEINAKSR